MNTTTVNPQTPSLPVGTSIQQQVNETINNLLASLPDPEKLSAEQRRGIIARYTAVLEGNFIYWMTGAYLSVKSDEARAIIRNAQCGRRQSDMEYTDVHGVCDVAHTAGLFLALDAEIALNPSDSETNLFEGVQVLRKLIERIVNPDMVSNGNHATA